MFLSLLKSRKRETETEIKILTPKKLLTWLPVLLAQVKAGNNSYELKNEIRRTLHKKLTITIEPKRISFDLPEDFYNNNIKNETDFIIKLNVFLAKKYI